LLAFLDWLPLVCWHVLLARRCQDLKSRLYIVRLSSYLYLVLVPNPVHGQLNDEVLERAIALSLRVTNKLLVNITPQLP
jgi:hypothetical protein